MSDLIIGVIVDVVLHLILDKFQGLGIVWVTAAAWDLVILAAAEFVVLDPEVGLEELQGRWKPKQGRVSRCKKTTRFCGPDSGQ